MPSLSCSKILQWLSSAKINFTLGSKGWSSLADLWPCKHFLKTLLPFVKLLLQSRIPFSVMFAQRTLIALSRLHSRYFLCKSFPAAAALGYNGQALTSYSIVPCNAPNSVTFASVHHAGGGHLSRLTIYPPELTVKGLTHKRINESISSYILSFFRAESINMWDHRGVRWGEILLQCICISNVLFKYLSFVSCTSIKLKFLKEISIFLQRGRDYTLYCPSSLA